MTAVNSLYKHSAEYALKKIAIFLLPIELCIILLTVKFSYLILGGIFSLIIIYTVFQKTTFGIYLIIILHLFIIKSTEGLNVFELLFGIILISLLAGWFSRKKFFQHEKIINTKVDLWLVIFLMSCILSLIPAILFNASLLKWFRELVPFLILFLFFPIVDLVERKEINLIILCLFFLGYYIAISNLIFYKSSIESAEKAWQLLAFRQTANEPVLFTLLTISICLIIYLKSKLIKFIMVLSAGLFGIALFATFSRGYWLAAIISLLCVALFSPKAEKLKITGYMLVLTVITLIFIEIFFGNIGGFILKAVAERFESLGETSKDISLLNRIIESKAVIGYIKSNPILGYGLGATYKFKSLIPREMPTWYVHNGFLFLFLKLGLLGTFSFLMFYLLSIYNGYVCIKKVDSNFIKAILVGIISCLIAILPLSLSSPQFIQKDSLLVIVIGTGMIETIRKEWKTG